MFHIFCVCFKETRRIVIGEIQHITYNEFLPLVLGKEVMAKFGLLLQKDVSLRLLKAKIPMHHE